MVTASLGLANYIQFLGTTDVPGFAPTLLNFPFLYILVDMEERDGNSLLFGTPCSGLQIAPWLHVKNYTK